MHQEQEKLSGKVDQDRSMFTSRSCPIDGKMSKNYILWYNISTTYKTRWPSGFVYKFRRPGLKQTISYF